RYFTLLTDIPETKIREYEEQLKTGNVNPRDIKMELAYTITEEYCGKEGAEFGKSEFINIVSNKGIPQDIKEVKIEQGKGILDLLVELNFVKSKGEAKRLIQGGGVKLDGEKITDQNLTLNIEKETILQSGKRNFAKLVK
ncbi:MAG: tyrosine--tRNA ligase, partial [bacterium]|nr:tyrosine--tRNA ligase [bacterium]